MEYQRGDDITVAIKGIMRVARHCEPARWYEFKEETTVKLRVQDSMTRDADRARLPAFLRAEFKKHWGAVEVRGYDYKRGYTYFLEGGTYRIISVETTEDRIKNISKINFSRMGLSRNKSTYNEWLKLRK